MPDTRLHTLSEMVEAEKRAEATIAKAEKEAADIRKSASQEAQKALEDAEKQAKEIRISSQAEAERVTREIIETTERATQEKIQAWRKTLMTRKGELIDLVARLLLEPGAG